MRFFDFPALALAPLLAIASCAVRPSTVPLGGADDPVPVPSARSSAASHDATSEAPPETDALDGDAAEPDAAESDATAPIATASDEDETSLDPGSFYFKPIPFKKGAVCEQDHRFEMKLLMTPPSGFSSNQIPILATQEQKSRITVSKMDGTNIAKARVEFLDAVEEMTMELPMVGEQSERRDGDMSGRTFDVDWSSSKVTVTSPDGKKVSDSDAEYAADTANVLRFQQVLPTSEPVKAGWVLEKDDVLAKLLGDETQLRDGQLKLRDVATKDGKDLADFDLEADFTQRESQFVIESEVTGNVTVSVDGARVQSINFKGPVRTTIGEFDGMTLEGDMTMRAEYRCADQP